MATANVARAPPTDHQDTATNDAEKPLRTVLTLTPSEYEHWKQTRVPRKIVEPVAVADDSVAARDSADGENSDKQVGSEPQKETDKPVTIHGELFESMAALRKRVKDIVARGNPMENDDRDFLVTLLKHHPQAKSQFADAPMEPHYVFRIQPLSNGDNGIFIKKVNLNSGASSFVHFPHKKAVKHFFPVTARPRRQTWHALQKRKRKARD